MKIILLALCLLILSACAPAINQAQADQVVVTPATELQYKKAIEAAKANKDYGALLKADMDLGRLYASHGNNEKARMAYAQGLSVAKQVLPANHPLTGFFLVQLSTTYMLEQNFDKACILLSEGIAILDKTPQLKTTVQKLQPLESLLTNFKDGLSSLKNQNYALAEQNFSSALVVGKQLSEVNLISISYSSIAIAQVMQDKSQEGEQSLKQALQYSEASGMKEAKAMALMGYEELFARRGDIGLAKKNFEMAVAEGGSIFDRMKVGKTILDQERQRLDMIEQAINAAQVPESADDYFSDALFHKKLIRWNDQTHTIKVYIAPGNQISGWKPEYIENFKKACLVWQAVLNNQVHFEFTENPADNVDTIITWSGEYKPKAGLTSYNFVANKLTKADIQFNLGTFDHHLYDTASVYKVSLHEIGHLLGIFGHSKNPKDIMFPTITLATQPSTRDTATLHLLYTKAPDITNPVGLTLAEYRKSLVQPMTKSLIESVDHF